MNKFFKRLALLLAVLMIVSMMPVQLFADNSVTGEEQSNGAGENSYLTISGIAGFKDTQFASFADAYTAIKPVLEGLCDNDALGQGVATAGAFDALFTNRDGNGNATLTYTISGNVVYDETDYANLLTMGRRASHYGNNRHLINFKFVGATGNDADTLTVNSNITLPYEWWGEKTVTSISFENLTITGSAPSGLYPSQSFFEGINFKVDNCNLKGIKIYNCSNVKGTYTITNSTLDGTGAPANAYAIHLQGNETEPLTINISGNTIRGYDCGINIDQKTANATISGNTISIKDAGRSCIQLSSLTSTVISNNTLELTGGNAITLHEKLLTMPTVPEITVKGNTITGNGYLIYDGAAAKSKAFTSKNLTLTIGTNTVDSTVDTTHGVYDGNKYDLSETVDTVVKSALTPAYVATVNGVGYKSLADAIAAAQNGDTIYVSAGEYTTYDDASPKKSLTFVGAGAGNTIWTIGDLSKNVGGEGNGDYSFDGCDTITFKNMTLKSNSDDYRGFIRVSNTIVENCTLKGKTAYWGYNTATFTGCTFNAPEGDYALWDYSTKTMTFDGCEFNISGKGVNVYVEAGNAGSEARKVEAKDCTINSTKANKAFLNIKNSTQAYEVTLSGDNKVNGLDANSTTGSNLYQVETTEVTETSGKTVKVQEKATDGTLTTVYEVKAASTAVAMVGGVEYASLADAIAAAKDGETVTLTADINTPETSYYIQKSLTIDLGGKTLTGSGYDGVFNIEGENAVVRIKNGKIVAVEQTGTAGKYTMAVWACAAGCEVTLEDLDVSQQITHTDDKQMDMIYTSKGTIIINSGRFESGTPAWTLNCNDSAYKAGTAKIIVNGGTFVGYDPRNNTAEGEGTSFVATGVGIDKNADGTFTAKAGMTAQVMDAKGASVKAFATLAEAITAAARNSTVTLLADTRENVTIDKALTLDLNGHTLNGGTVKAKPALTITARTVTIKDSSEAQTGTIMREDTAENSGVSSHYVIDIQGNAWVMFESGIVKNGSGAGGTKGASLVRVGDDSVAQYPGLNIKGGTFTQDNFIVIKVDRGDLFLNGGTLNSANSYAVENWLRATIKGGTVNGAVSSWTYSSGSNSTLTISGGTINGNVESVSYDGSAGKKASVSITGGTVNGTLSTKIYGEATTPGKDVATIEVTGGTFTKDPTKYVIEGSAITDNGDGTFGVAKAYLAKVGNTSYYTMDEAFKAQTASGEPIVLLRDYTTGSPFKSGSINRTVDLSGFTWTCTGTDANSAAFEINYSDVTLTVKNGKVISSQLVGLIPSAMGGTIKYDNSSLTFENVQMSTTATSGIETNGNNTNDTVTLKNSTLNVPNGFGIYFPSSGTLTLDNSTVNAKTMGVQVCAGSLSINEGSAVTVTGDAVEKTENDGAIQDGAAISIVNRTGYKGLGTVTVSGGTFTAKEGNSAIKAYNWVNNTESKFTASEKVAVSGGTFSSAVPEEYCAEGFIPTKNADGTYGVKEGKYVAQIGNVKYETLAEAVATAKDGDTVKLLDDVDLTETLIIRDKTITLDLNGKTISNSTDIWNESTYSWSLISVRDNGDLTIDDTVGGGTLKAKENDCFTLDVYAYDTKNVENTRLTVNAGNYIGNISAVYAFTGKVTINGGHFSIQQKESGSDPYRLTLNCYDSSYTAGRAGFTVNGGMFENFDPRNNLAEGAGTSFVAEGVGIDKNADGTFTAKSGMAAQIVGADGNSVAAYAGHYDAIAAAKDGETVILLSDRKNFVTNTINANITIDLNGKTLSVGNNNPFFRTNGEVTIQNGTIDSQYACVIVNAYNKLTLKNVKITGVTGDNGKNLVNVCSNAEVTIDKDTVLTASGSNGAAVFIGQDMDAKYTLNVYGKVIQESKSFAISGNGSYKGTTTINIYDGAEVKSASVAIYHPQAGVINVNGGLVEGYCAIGIKSGTLNINGGTVRGTADDHVLDDSNSTSGTITYDGSAIIVDSRSTGYAGNVNINVTGGTVESYYSTAIREIGEQDKPNMTQLTKLNVIGGSVLGASKNPVNVTSDMLVRDISVINISVSGGTFKHAIPEEYCADRFIPTQNADGTYGVQKAMKGSEKNPYTLEELGAMTRAQYIAAQEALGGTMYVEIGDYSYDKNGVLGNGVRNDTPGQTPDHSKLNAYGENGYLGEKNDGANGKNIIFVGGSITSRVTGYTSIDNIGTSLLLAVPAYTNVTFEGTTFNNVMSFNYQLYTSPWSQLGELKFSGCTFNGIIVGAIAAQTLTFNKCTFTNYTNEVSKNNSNPTWIRPAYGNWTKGDNEGQGDNFKSLTTINFTNNKVTSTRPVKFERIAQWEMDTKVSVKNNKVTISAQEGDTSTKNVGFYFGANAKFDLTLDGNEKLGTTSALYTAVYSAPNEKSYAGLPAGSTVKDSNGADVEVAGVIWKSTTNITLKTTTEAVEVAGVKFATLEEAYAAAANGDTITLLEDCKSGRINLEDKSVTVVLNGKTLTSTAAYGVMFCAKNGNKITIDGTVEGSKLVGTLMITAETDGHIEVNGGTYENSQYCPIYVNGAVSSEKSTVTVKNAIIKATNSSSDQDMGCGVYLAGYSTSVFENCTITAPITGIEIRAGKLTLNNCDVTGGNGKVTADANGNGTTVTNAALAISQHTTKKPIDVTINGGTFNGTAAVYQTDVQGTGSADVKIAVKSGTFDGTISGETDGAIVISGGKFKDKVDDKYFADKLACSATPNADGYYTVKDHPIISAGISIGEDMSFRIIVGKGYENGKLKYYYDTIGEDNTIVRVEGEGILGTDTKGNSIFRIYNVNPQRADLIYVIQYYDADGNAVGAPKEISVLTYFEGFYNMEAGKNEDVDARKTFIANFLEYCASAMERSYALHKDVTLNGKTWQDRADAVRAMMTRLGLETTDYEFKGNLGRYFKDNSEGIILKRGVVFGSTFKAYYQISKEAIDNGCKVFRQGMDITDKLELVDGAYRLYFEIAPYEFKDNLTITVYNGTTKVCEYTSPLANTLEVLSKSTDASLANMAKAAFNYFVALQNYNG